MKISSLIPVVLLGTTLLISGCSSKDVQVDNSNFLNSKKGFVESGKLEGTKTYISQEADFSAYDNIYVAPIKVLSAIPEDELTPNQKQLKQQMSEYLTQHYKDLLAQDTSYTLVADKNTPKTLVYEGSVSSVEVEFDDLSGMNFMPMMFVGTMVARATFKDGNIRILGEGRIKDAQTNEVLIQMMRLHKGKEVDANAEDLKFTDVKPTLDDWLKDSKRNLAKIRAGVLKVEHNRS